MPERYRMDARRAAGLCVSCGSEPTVAGRAKCERCLQEARDAAAARRARAGKLGLCDACMKRKSRKGLTRCAVCAAKYLPAQLKRERAKRTASSQGG